jgi:membrane associated rhomboid family serine protease
MFPLRDTIPSRSFPIITVVIICLNLLIFFYEFTLGAKAETLISSLGMIPASFANFLSVDISSWPPLILTLFSSVFLHGSWFHVISNMWYLWIFGDNIEDRTGHLRFLLFYLLCGLLAGIAHIVMNPLSEIPTIGASGAVAGIMGAYIVLFPRSKITTLIFLVIFIQIVRIPAIIFLGFWFLLQLLSGTFSLGIVEQSGGVAWWAHIGGFFTGMIFVFLFKKRSY